MMEIVDYEDILIYILYLKLNYNSDVKKHGLDVKITNRK